MTPILNIAIRAARQANEYIVQNIDKREPGALDDDADQKLLDHLETSLFQVLMDHLKRGYPAHYVAEPGETLAQDKEDSWQIHGFENITPFGRRFPGGCYSITHKQLGKTQHCLIVNPFTGDEYTATRGRGAAINSHRIRCTATKSLSDAVIATNILNNLTGAASDHVKTDLLRDIAQSGSQVAITGNIIMDITLVAAGQADAVILENVDPSTLDGVLLLCQEAGTLSGSLSGGLVREGKKGSLVVANPKLYKSIVQRLGGYEKKLLA
jgi:myo-inositol-1(or 4)-monophosphatase